MKCHFASGKPKNILVVISKSVASRSRKAILSFCLSCISLKTIQYVKDTDILEHIQQMTPRWIGIESHNAQRNTLNWTSSTWRGSRESLFLPKTPCNWSMLWIRFQTFLRSVQWKEVWQWAQVGTQEISDST